MRGTVGSTRRGPSFPGLERTRSGSDDRGVKFWNRSDTVTGPVKHVFTEWSRFGVSVGQTRLRRHRQRDGRPVDDEEWRVEAWRDEEGHLFFGGRSVVARVSLWGRTGCGEVVQRTFLRVAGRTSTRCELGSPDAPVSGPTTLTVTVDLVTPTPSVMGLSFPRRRLSRCVSFAGSLQVKHLPVLILTRPSSVSLWSAPVGRTDRGV